MLIPLRKVSRYRLFLFAVVLTGVLLTIILLSVHGPGNGYSITEMKQIRSDEQLGQILQDLDAYQLRHHGKWPKTILDLAFDKPDDLSSYYAPIMPDSERPTGWRTDKGMLAKNVGYSLSSNSNSGILAFEKPGIWPDGTIAVGFSDHRILRMQQEEFRLREAVGSDRPLVRSSPPAGR